VIRTVLNIMQVWLFFLFTMRIQIVFVRDLTKDIVLNDLDDSPLVIVW
jgi:hypothetical protein